MWCTFCLFWRDDSGAVTVDWVVLSAAIVGIGMVVLLPFAHGTESLADYTADKIRDAQIDY